MSNTHGIFIYLGNGSRAFIDGIPDKCEHDSEGNGFHFVTTIETGHIEYIPANPEETQKGLQEWDIRLRAEGKYLSGGCVSCSKCGKPFEPDIHLI